MNTLSEGELAPDFSLPSTISGTVSLSSLKGKNVILYFYPKDDTPGCSQEAQDFKEKISQFKSLNTEIVGVSKDDMKAHKNFCTRYDLPFPLLSDKSSNVIETYGAWVEKSMFGKKYFGIERSTYLIDKDGIVRKIWRKVQVKGHVNKVLDAINQLSNN